MHNSEKFLVLMTTLKERYELEKAPATAQSGRYELKKAPAMALETSVIASTVYEYKVRLTGTAIQQNNHRGPKMLPQKV